MSSKSENKKSLILKTAMQLFALKGVSSTSMQEIAESCGMSKGSIYLHFKSKEELEGSVIGYCFGTLQEHLTQVEQQQELSPREKLCQQTKVLLDLVLELREFLTMQVKDWIANGPSNHNHEFIIKHSILFLHYCREKLINVYGPDIAPYSADLILFGHGAISSYVHLLLNPRFSMDTTTLANYFVGRLDVTAESLLRDRSAPLISEEMQQQWGEMLTCNVKPQRHPLEAIKLLKIITENLIGDPDERNHALQSLQILEEELSNPSPRHVIITGMLANLAAFSILDNQLSEIKQLIQHYYKP